MIGNVTSFGTIGSKVVECKEKKVAPLRQAQAQGRFDRLRPKAVSTGSRQADARRGSRLFSGLRYLATDQKYTRGFESRMLCRASVQLKSKASFHLTVVLLAIVISFNVP